MVLPFIILGVLLLVCLYTDLKRSIIPNVLSLGGLVFGMAYYAVMERWSGLLFSFGGAMVGFLVMLALYVFGALGAGDVKLFAAIGALMGIEFVLYTAMYSIVFAGFFGFFYLLLRGDGLIRIKHAGTMLISILTLKQWKQLYSPSSQHLTFPFMIAVVPGVLTSFYYFEFLF